MLSILDFMGFVTWWGKQMCQRECFYWQLHSKNDDLFVQNLNVAKVIKIIIITVIKPEITLKFMMMGVTLWLIYYSLHKFVAGKVKQYNSDADRSSCPFNIKRKCHFNVASTWPSGLA